MAEYYSFDTIKTVGSYARLRADTKAAYGSGNDDISSNGVCVYVGDPDLSSRVVQSSVRVSAGFALIRGYQYRTDDSIDFPIPTPTGGTTGHRVVLRIDFAAETITMVLKSSSNGTATIPALTQNTGVIWEEAIAAVTVTTGGIITVTGQLGTIGVSSGHWWNERKRSPHVWGRRGGSKRDWYTPGTTEYAVTASSMMAGVVTWTGSASTGTAVVDLTGKITPGFIPFASLRTTHVTVGARADGEKIYLDWRTVDGSIRTSLDIHWMTIGPE